MSSRQARLDARNERLKKKREERAKNEARSNANPTTVVVVHTTTTATKPPVVTDKWAEYERLSALAREASEQLKSFVRKYLEEDEKSVPFDCIEYIRYSDERKTSKPLLRYVEKNRSKNILTSHFAGANSTEANRLLAPYLEAEAAALRAVNNYRAKYIYPTEGNTTLQQQRSIESASVFEEIHRGFHTNPFDLTSPAHCIHKSRSDSPTILLPCDCERTFVCGCVLKPKCEKCGDDVCKCGIMHATYDVSLDRVTMCKLVATCVVRATVEKDRSSLDINPLSLLSLPSTSMKPSVRGCARIAHGKAMVMPLRPSPPVLITRVVYETTKQNENKSDTPFHCETCTHEFAFCHQTFECDCVRMSTEDGSFLELSALAKLYSNLVQSSTVSTNPMPYLGPDVRTSHIITKPRVLFNDP